MGLLATRDVASVPALLAARAAATPHGEALRAPTSTPRGWTALTWSQVAGTVTRGAAALRSLGVVDGDRVALLSSTRTEWIVADLAILTAGCATTAVYPSSTPDECAFVVGDSGSRVVVVEDAAQLAKLDAVRSRIPDVAAVVVIDADDGGVGEAAEGGRVLSWRRFLERGDRWLAERPDGVDETVDRITPDRLASLVYTSGTTGPPKGVELTHGSWLYVAGAAAELGILTGDDVHFLWLPLSHVFGKLLVAVMVDTGVTTSVDGRVERIVDNLADVRPTVMAAAPRIFEKAHNAVVSTVREQGGLRLALFRWARDVALRAEAARRDGAPVPPLLAAQLLLADALVLSKVRARFGGRIRAFVSGSAPLSPEMTAFFTAVGMPVLEGYGLTESCAASCVNPPGAARPGTVGPPLPGTEVRIADDGEVLLRGPGLMRGYHGLPEETASALRGGWLHTGDIGELDDGYLRITDRKKELIKTSGGKYVVPASIEGRIKAASPYVSQVLVHGDRRSHVTALVTLDPDACARWAAARGLPGDPAALARTDEVTRLVGAAVDAVNETLPRYATVKRFAVLDREFAVETGELTASLKLRRRAIEQRHAAVLDALYDEAVERV